MFDFNGFGKRVHSLRKQKGMTQDELAERMGITPQAVSKWENDQSYPDIPTIPALAMILDTDINFLFGQSDLFPANQFPAEYKGLPLVHNNGAVACYSNKVVASKDATGVKFADGSVVELSTRLITNYGTGEIVLQNIEAVGVSPHDLNRLCAKGFEFDAVTNIDIGVLMNRCKIIPSPDNKTRVHATGEEYLLSRLKVEAGDGTLRVYFTELEERHNNYNSRNTLDLNQITIELPHAVDSNAKLSISGMGSITTRGIQFAAGQVKINGSGNMQLPKFTDTCSITTNGSGVIEGQYAKHLNISINGSGAVTWQQVEKNTTLAINGSGDVSVNHIGNEGNVSANINGNGTVAFDNGTCDKFYVKIGGTGDVKANNITAKTAHIIIQNSGSVILGRVLESSTEQVSKRGLVDILHRGV